MIGKDTSVLSQIDAFGGLPYSAEEYSDLNRYPEAEVDMLSAAQDLQSERV